MAKNYDDYSSQEDITEQVSALEHYPDLGEDPLGIDDAIIELQEEAQDRAAFAASELMTGVRGRDEQQEFLEEMELFHRTIGAIACKICSGVYREGGDSSEAKRQALLYLKWSYQEMVASDYKKRLEQPVEQSKKRLALNRRERIATSLGGGALMSLGALKAAELASSYVNVNLTHEQQSAVGMAAIAVGLAYTGIHSALQDTRTRLKQAFTKGVNGAVGPYLPPDGFVKDSKEDELTLNDKLTQGYAKRHLEPVIGKISVALGEYDIETEADTAPMMEAAISTGQTALYKSYGIQVERETRKPWYRRWAAEEKAAKLKTKSAAK